MSLLLAAALTGLSACSTPKTTATTTPTPPIQMAKQFRFSRSERYKLQYLLFLPKGYEPKGGKKWPLIFFLHGVGERGTNVWKVAIHGPPKHVVENPDFPFIVVSPQCREDRTWANAPLLALLDEVCRKYAVDTNRVYLTGLSMGGYGAWHLGLAYPERFAAMAPICGGGDLLTPMVSNWDKPQALKSLAIWAFHGAKDPVVPLKESQRMVEVAKKLGVKEVKLTVYPEAQHNCWTQTYNNPKLYEWFLQHRRGPASK